MPDFELPRPIRVDAEVVENRAEGGENLRLRLRVPGWPGFLPGQFVMLSPGARTSVERTDPLLPRPICPASTSATRTPAAANAYAVMHPARPPPTITTSA